MMRVPTYYQDLIDIVGSNPGHVIGSTACLGGFLPAKILQYRSMDLGKNELYQKIIGWCNAMQNIFGKGNFFFEMQPSNNEEQIIVNKELLTLSNKLDIPYIITTDSHYLKKSDASIHEAYLNSQDGDREVKSFYATTYMMGTEELESFFEYFDEYDLQIAYQNILKIKDMCSDYSLLKPLKIPELQWRPFASNKDSYYYWVDKIPMLKTFIDSPHKSDRCLVDAIIEGIENHADLQNEESYKELNENLERTWISSEVNKARWSAYYLNLQFTIDKCWEAETVVGPSRGSGGGFLLLYCLDIIQMNKLREPTPMYPWRFLNPSRVSVLDIDTDIEGGRRPKVLSHLREVYGEDRMANVVTFGTEKSKSAILTAARGLGIEVDTAQYISSLVPADRGQLRTLTQCYYGDEDKGFAPVTQFINEMNNYPDLWEVAKSIEGLVCRTGIHAGGIIFVDEPFTESTALMRAPDGTLCTQFDLHDCEDVSLIKIDLLSVEAMDKIHVCLDLICDAGYAERKSTLRETYESIIGVYNLERDDPKMWDMVLHHKINSLFQMEQQSGIQGIAIAKPKSIDDLAVLNSVIRLMAPEKGMEQPLEMWARYRSNIKEWYNEMWQYGLSADAIDWLSKHPAIHDGICESQEGLMSLVQEERLGGNDLSFADRCRKAIAKKQGRLFEECEREYFENAVAKGCDMKLAHYVWDVLFRVQRGYSFNASHTHGYSLVALQEMNLAYKYPIVFWNCACLITDSGSLEDNSTEEIVDIYAPEKEDMENGVTFEDLPDRKGKIKKTSSTDYNKVATAIGKMSKSGITICPPDINKSNINFVPDAKENKIYCGFKSLLNVGDEVVIATIKNRPYHSPKDYVAKVNPNKRAMISLIKSGAFDNMAERKFVMAWYLWETCDKKARITLQNMPGLIKYDLIPQTEELQYALKVYEFNRYLKAKCAVANKTAYKLDSRALQFILDNQYDDLLKSQDNNLFLIAKDWDKIYQKEMDIFRGWIASDKQGILDSLNHKIFKEAWNEYANGNYSSWEMEVMCYYHHEHELAHMDFESYGIRDFYSMPSEPIVDRTFYKGGRQIKMFKLSKICGTCIAKNKAKGIVELLTPTGVVTVKLRKEYFAFFDRRIFRINPDGTKTIIEKSWFDRGKKIIVQGIRQGDAFVGKKYANTGHQLYLITDILPDGKVALQEERIDEREDNV